MGLGNPLRKYENTPHNAGFMCIDALCQEFDVKMEKDLGHILYTDFKNQGNRIVLAKPLTYMNESGRGVIALKNWLKFENDQLVIIYDDIDIPLSEIRIRKKGSAGTHKGMKSIIQYLGDISFPRIRIGISDSQKNRSDLVQYVLTPLRGKKLEELKIGVLKAVDAVKAIIEKDIDSIMNIFNRRTNSLLPNDGG